MFRNSINFGEIVVDFIKLYGIRAIFIDEIKGSIDLIVMKVRAELQHHSFELCSIQTSTFFLIKLKKNIIQNTIFALKNVE